ncbi:MULTISPECIES: sigma-70 family RNA polymerase sigma factor [unclassified Streptomyces]|uniref:sigma-70 family RNA polymerase sigma factor n=1 Tax=unclassified Streptomyces TaxID=2593676 RepID=UPI000DBACFB0|nr:MULTISPECIES: sigma-70 family RNA polymerase sigma factor [unclassified Streptomyces]MYT68281.1 sigma-70 family RNA polymerase sigma factor [Streptomyces sp. SID8367]RAJ76915.1 DNA-directed RNA polymerase specialized sigma24 family protein [Streptomyces sp. PsTaAH-137]
MTPPPTSTSGSGSRPGRRLGPIASSAGPTHRAWLQQVRDAFEASGKTLLDLERDTNWSRSKISELLRAAGRYPRWEPIHTLLTALGWPNSAILSLRNLWIRAAQEARKRPGWISGCVQAQTGVPPVEFTAFRESRQGHYHAYAATFLRRPAQARRAVEDVFTLLRIVWDEALASNSTAQFAWRMLRDTVLERAPQREGHPALDETAYASQALRQQAAHTDRVRQLRETLRLYDGIRRLPPKQLDVMVLRFILGLPEESVHDVMGLSLPDVRSCVRHARRTLSDRFPPAQP